MTSLSTNHSILLVGMAEMVVGELCEFNILIPIRASKPLCFCVHRGVREGKRIAPGRNKTIQAVRISRTSLTLLLRWDPPNIYCLYLLRPLLLPPYQPLNVVSANSNPY